MATETMITRMELGTDALARALKARKDAQRIARYGDARAEEMTAKAAAVLDAAYYCCGSADQREAEQLAADVYQISTEIAQAAESALARWAVQRGPAI